MGGDNGLGAPGKSFANGRESAPERDTDAEESCVAFGFLRGIRDRAVSLELRFRDGNSDLFSYSLFAGWRYHPSVGLLLKFTSDVVTLVLIRGSNLAAPVRDTAVNLTERGIARHRVTWVREMTESELKAVGKSGPTIDRIEIHEFESPEQQRDWLRQNAPVFAR